MIALSTTLTILVLWSAPADAISESKLAERKTLGETSATCPDKWLDASFVEMGCLFFNNTAAADWEEANVICKEYSNATLVDIKTEMQMGFLQMELDVIANAEGASHNWWTAGTDLGREGEWYWATTLTDVGDFVWHWNSDNPDSGTAENCLYLNCDWGYEGGDADCDGTFYPICQMT